jgi:hypothetical protein
VKKNRGPINECEDMGEDVGSARSRENEAVERATSSSTSSSSSFHLTSLGKPSFARDSLVALGLSVVAPLSRASKASRRRGANFAAVVQLRSSASLSRQRSLPLYRAPLPPRWQCAPHTAHRTPHTADRRTAVARYLRATLK